MKESKAISHLKTSTECSWHYATLSSDMRNRRKATQTVTPTLV